MSIKGIDAQIMITRLSDTVREASATHRRPEMAQDFLAIKEKINDAEAQSRVAKMAESEMEKVRSDVDEGGGGAYSGDGASNQDGEITDDELNPDLAVPPGNYIIDIII